MKLYLKEAKLNASVTNVNPYVVCHVGLFEWKSPAPMEKDLSALLWSELEYFKYDVFKPEELIVIEMKDKDSDRGTKVIGRCEVPCHFFAQPGGRDEWLELNLLGKPIGTIRIASEFSGREAKKA